MQPEKIETIVLCCGLLHLNFRVAELAKSFDAPHETPKVLATSATA